MQFVDTPHDVDLLTFGGGLMAGLSRYDHPAELIETDTGDDWLKFHFQLRGSACYSVEGHADMIVDGAGTAFCFHGKGIAKRTQVAAKPGFAVTVLCHPQSMVERFGLRHADLPTPIRNYLEHGDSAWFSEAGKLTPEMTMSLRSLETMTFQGGMRHAYVEARSVELVCDLWSHIARAVPDNGAVLDDRTAAKVERTRAHIDACYADPLAMPRLARQVGTNETKLSQAFRTVFGMTIFEYIRSRRMEEARRLLRAGNLSVTEVAMEVGYDYPCNFSVAYKRHYGISPKQERAGLPH